MIISKVAAFAEPWFEEGGLLIIAENDSNGDFCRKLIIRAVVRDGRDRIAGKPMIRLLSKCLGESMLH
jgi:hypothetical protein